MNGIPWPVDVSDRQTEPVCAWQAFLRARRAPDLGAECEQNHGEHPEGPTDHLQGS